MTFVTVNPRRIDAETRPGRTSRKVNILSLYLERVLHNSSQCLPCPYKIARSLVTFDLQQRCPGARSLACIAGADIRKGVGHLNTLLLISDRAWRRRRMRPASRYMSPGRVVTDRTVQ